MKTFENFTNDITYHVYKHPCSTHLLYYLIPDKYNDMLKNDKNFKIGMYKTPFKEYLNTFYDEKKHGSNKSLIEHIGEYKIDIPKWAHKYDTETGAYYYEFVDDFSKNAEWVKLNIFDKIPDKVSNRI